MASTTVNASYTVDLLGLDFTDTGPSAFLRASTLLDEEETFYDCNDTPPNDSILGTLSQPNRLSGINSVGAVKTIPLTELWGLKLNGPIPTASPEAPPPLDLEPPSNKVNGAGALNRDVILKDPPHHTPENGEPVADKGTEDAQEFSDDSETEVVGANADPKQKSSKRKLEDRRAFDKWRLRHATKLANEEIKLRVRAELGKELTVDELIRNDQPRIIGDPREYQLELFERAKKQNTIAVLDTGSGKTLIAVLLLRHILDQELEDRSMGKKPRIAFFLVDSVALVFQQWRVLEDNLDQSIERFCGQMGTDHWAKMTWQQHLKNNMVIVCTAEILHQCLMRSFIQMDQINLLIFDEAHHAKKNHPYARIIKDHYITETDLSRRPKVFGMTASPVDVRSNFTQAAKELEAMLHCQIATTADLALLRHSVSRPNEHVAVYNKLYSPGQTILCQEMEQRFGDMDIFDKTFRNARNATTQLGAWCADQVWSFTMSERAALKLERKLQKRADKEQNSKPVEMMDAQLSQLREAQAFVQNWPSMEPTIDTNSLSPKVMVLRDYLRLVFERPTEARCIVFVHQRYTARLLGELFTRLRLPNLHQGTLVGTRSGDAGELEVSFRQQMEIIHKFRKGQLNCLFATAVAEEGLDIPECNLVIRFDLYDTLIQYIQSRGRARHANSKYVHMVEEDNQIHMQAVRDVRKGEAVLRLFCEALPADRLLQGNDANLEDALIKEKLLRTFVEPTSGAKLTYASSLVVLNHFVSCVVSDNPSPPHFVMRAEHGQYTCEVVLPSGCPIGTATGRPSVKKSIAKRSAAFEACLILRKGGLIDENFLPKTSKILPAMRNAHLALNVHKSSSYDMKVKPKIWEDSRGSLPDSLYMTVLTLQKPANLGRESQPIALLTRTQMPDFPSVLLHLQVDKTSQLVLHSLQGSVPIPREALSRLNSFTLRIYKDVFNKKFEVNEAAMSYWFAPVVKHFQHTSGKRTSHDLIDWPIVNYVFENEAWEWNTNRSDEDLHDRYLVDKWDGSRRFWSIKVRPDLRPQDPVPADAAPHRYMNTILDYTVSLFSKSRKNVVWLPDQPVIYAHRILHRLNWLDEFLEKDKKVKTNAYVVPEPLLFSALPAAVAGMAYMIPSAISRVESYLIALETCDMLGLSIHPDLALEAITKDSDNTSEHRQEQVHLQRGMGKNYERLEFIGDCFLKMATSISVFCIKPDENEYAYHVRRMLLICNQNLFTVALKRKLYEYIRSVGFSRRTWYPEGIKLLEGKGFNKTRTEVYKHQLGDKTVADVCEALIGAALLSHNSNGNMDMAAKAVTAMVGSPDHNVSRWADYYKLYKLPRYQLAQASAVQTNLAMQIEQKMGYSFRYPRLLMSAFVHTSLASLGGIPSYQRLEFLGDSLLDMACVNFIFHRHPDRDPQWLTEHKVRTGPPIPEQMLADRLTQMAMVSNKFLAAVSVKLGFHKHLRFSSPAIEFQNREYAQEIEEAERESNGARDYWTTTKNPPKCLSDIVESYIGAVFVDSEFDYSEVERFFNNHIRWFFEDLSIYDTFANHHPVTHLHNLLTLSLGCSSYRIMSSPIFNAMGDTIKHQVAVVIIHGHVIASGQAASSKNAKVKAAAKALEALKGLAPFEFRGKYGCGCTGDEVVEEVGTAI
ncbi:MAG: hypothetical protein Q9218_006367 [Villophora microphyllina]